MVNFLIHRPIAVTMTFIAVLILGLVSTTRLPVSLMPDVDIPKITVQVSYANHSAIELEQTIAKPLRQQLMQVSHLADIHSESRDGSCIFHLDFDYGNDINYLFIEVNEKIDRAINSLPRDLPRPKVIKASATDIPVFYLNLTFKQTTTNHKPRTTNQEPQTTNNELFSVTQQFVELSNFSGQVIRKRIEQLQEVAMVDMSGQVFPELLIIPDLQKMEALKLTLEDIEQSINANNINLGNLLIRDGQYQYSIRFATTLKEKKDIDNIYIKIDDRLIQIKEIARIIEHPGKRSGLVTSNGRDAVTMAVIKQSDAQMRTLKTKLNELIKHFKNDYPHIDFEVTRNQTVLLDYSISNLLQSLLLGGLLAFLIMFLFLKDFKSPFLIGIVIPTSLVTSLLFLYIAGISLNIISLSGLILGIGMMIDNSIIVIDNITQHWERSNNRTIEPSNHRTTNHKLLTVESALSADRQLNIACINGTNEVFRPLLSSVLTTCAVFIPMIFISGISGALFFDQAMAIIIGLFVSLAISITLLPVYYRLFYLRSRAGKKSILERLNTLDYEKLYEKGFRVVMRNQGWAWFFVFVMIIVSYPLYTQLERSKLPQVAKDEALLYVDWNERIHIDENNARLEEMMTNVGNLIAQHTCLIGTQQFLLDHSTDLSASESIIYFKASSVEKLDTIKYILSSYLKKVYPNSLYNYTDAGNIFDLLFSENSPPLIAKLRATKDLGNKKNIKLQQFVDDIKRNLPGYPIEPISWEEHIVVKLSPEKLTAYNITFDAVYRVLKSAFSENEILIITENQQFTPVILGDESRLVNEILDKLTVQNNEGEKVSIRSLLKQGKDIGLKTIVAGSEGEYFPLNFDVDEKDAEEIMGKIRDVASSNGNFEADFTGSVFSTRRLLKELAVILVISLLLLYFILASQFESLILPVIILIEVPIDIFGAFIFLWIFGESLNLMSLIGVITMSGIIINDSILKIDTINQLRRQGYSLIHALAVAGQRRLKPILMTSLTTILALLPFLFISGIGADLQQPLSVAIIGGMTIGTMVSLYFIPLLYYRLNKKSSKYSIK